MTGLERISSDTERRLCHRRRLVFRAAPQDLAKRRATAL